MSWLLSSNLRSADLRDAPKTIARNNARLLGEVTVAAGEV